MHARQDAKNQVLDAQMQKIISGMKERLAEIEEEKKKSKRLHWLIHKRGVI